MAGDRRPWSPAEAEQKLSELVDVLDDAVVDIAEVRLKAARAEHDYKLAEAKAFTRVRSTGVSVEEAKRRALMAVEDEHLEHMLTDATARSSSERIGVLKAQCDALRSLLVSARGVSS